METKMRQLVLKMCVAGACALGLIAFNAPTMAQDQEDLAVEKDLRPDEEPIILEDEGVKPKEAMPEESKGDSDANIEDKMIDEIGPGAE
jgi:hypothetical protein